MKISETIYMILTLITLIGVFYLLIFFLVTQHWDMFALTFLIILMIFTLKQLYVKSKVFGINLDGLIKYLVFVYVLNVLIIGYGLYLIPLKYFYDMNLITSEFYDMLGRALILAVIGLSTFSYIWLPLNWCSPELDSNKLLESLNWKKSFSFLKKTNKGVDLILLVDKERLIHQDGIANLNISVKNASSYLLKLIVASLALASFILKILSYLYTVFESPIISTNGNRIILSFIISNLLIFYLLNKTIMLDFIAEKLNLLSVTENSIQKASKEIPIFNIKITTIFALIQAIYMLSNPMEILIILTSSFFFLTLILGCYVGLIGIWGDLILRKTSDLILHNLNSNNGSFRLRNIKIIEIQKFCFKDISS